MMELANTTITIMRGVEANAYGDLSDVGTPVYTGVPAAVTEASKQTWDPATQQPRTIRTLKALVPIWTDILTSDTIRDETNGNYYMINDLQRQPVGPTGITPSIILTLRERSGVGTGSD